MAGVWGALGLCTHLRFVLVPLGGALWLLGTSAGRRQLRRPGPWITLALLAVGLLPMLIFNLQNDFASVAYHIEGRHGSSFDSSQLLRYLIGQAVSVTPMLMAVFVATAYLLVKRARCGDELAAMTCCFAFTPFVVYLVASPFEDTGQSTRLVARSSRTTTYSERTWSLPFTTSRTSSSWTTP